MASVENGLMRGVGRSLVLSMRTGAVPLSQTYLGLALETDKTVIAGAAPVAPGATDKLRQGVLLTVDNCPYFTFTEPSTKRYANAVATDLNGSVWGTTVAVGATRWAYSNLFGDLLIDQRGAVLVETPAAFATAPAAWYRYGVGITVTGAGVSSWADQSGNGRDLLQGTDTNRPALQADNSILFDGSDNYLGPVAFTHNQPVTWYALMRQVTWTAGDRFFDGAAATVTVVQQTATPNIRINAGSGGADNTNLAVNTYGIVAVVFNGASSLLQINNTTPSTVDAGANNPGGFNLGTSSNSGNIQVKEVVLFSAAHDAAQRALVIDYLMNVGKI